jgi:hypothetical protein
MHVTRIAIGPGTVNCKVHGTAVTVRNVLGKAARKGDAIVGGELMWKGKLIFTCYPGILSTLTLFGLVPKRRTVGYRRDGRISECSRPPRAR